MRGTVTAAGLLLLFAARAHARPAPARTSPHTVAPAPRTDFRPAPPLPMLPRITRVRIEAARDAVVVVEEVNLPRGEWQSGGLDLYVAFGAPGAPVAIDAHLVAVPPDSLESRLEDAGDPLTLEQAIRRTPSSQLLLGRPQMAGVVVHVREADLRRAFGASELAALRIRSLLHPPAADASGARDVVVRLGIAGGLPLTLGRVQVVSLEGRQWITRVEATLCGPEADLLPLTVALVPRAAEVVETRRVSSVAPTVGPIAPAMAVRHASDDLCVRWWAES
jgi:hypothetical protein